MKFPAHFENALLPCLGKTHKLIHLYCNEKYKEGGIDLRSQQAILLNIIAANDGLVQNDLAFFTNRDKTTLTRLINSLETKDLVQRISSKSDKRKKKIFITDEGRKMIDRIRPIIKNAMQDLESGVTEEEKEIVKKVLSKMRNNITENSSVVMPINFE